jgi:hypothetical protein
MMLQPRLVDELLAAELHGAFERWLDVVEDVDGQEMIADLELPREGFGAVCALLEGERRLD